MLSLRKVILIIAFATISTFAQAEYSDEEIERGDKYVDKLLYQMFVDSDEEYDPYRIDDSRIGFHRQVAFVNVSGEAKLYDGYIKNLKTLHRPEHCKLREEGDRLNVAADLGAGVLHFHYSGTVKFMNWGPSVSVEGELAYIEVHMEFSVDSKTGRKGRLEKFVIDDMRGMETRITGLGPLTWAMSPIVNGVAKLFKGYLQNFLEKKVKNHLAKYIPNYQFPVEGIVTENPTTVTEPTEPEPEPETETPEPEPEPETESPETEEPVEETENPIEEDEDLERKSLHFMKRARQ
ncbi:uncharacterized protein LOC129218681 [Uloborus diversus]|uniref:uncharacterized protein LOC129218681 n=1 Tax=Uloborus diversus TaxID=327109 RepID=UPI002409BC7F|nr:uncharacterized protein LOC129218681 [Uloborus diversus]